MSFVYLMCRDLEKTWNSQQSLGRKKKDLFFFLQEKVAFWLASWKENLLSPTEKEVLMKSVVSAIPSYAMSSFLLPKAISNFIDKQQRAF